MAFGSNMIEGALKNPLVRSFLASKGLDEQIMNLLQANATVGQPAEVMFPLDMLPILLRLVGTGALNMQVANTHRDWVWPWFLTRQLDPTDPGFCVRGHNPLYLNMHYRNWTGIGVFGETDEAVVDPAGLLTPRRMGWSLDVWVKTPDGHWVFPSRCYGPGQPAPRQELVQNLPVVRTSLDLGDGHTLTLTHFAHLFDQTPLACLHAVVTGPQAEKFNVALALRPCHPEGMTLVHDVQLKENHWLVNGEPAVALGGTPVLQGASNFLDGDVAIGLLAENPPAALKVHCRSGFATAFALFGREAVAHAAMVPVSATEDSLKELSALDPVVLEQQAVAAWRQELAAAPKLWGVDGRTQALYEASQSWVLLVYDADPHTDMDQITPGPLTYHHFWFRDCAYLTTALDRLGRHDLAERIGRTYPHRQKPDGFFESQEGEWDANGQAMFTLFEHYRLTGDEKFLREVYPSMNRGARWIARKRKRGKRDEGGLAQGLLPAGFSAEHLGSNDYYYWDNFWCLRGLRDTAAAAAILGKHEDAQQWSQEADAFAADIEASLEKVARRLGKPLLPASPLVRINSGAIGSLGAVYPAGVLAAGDERVINTVAAVRETSFFEGAFFQHIYHSGTNIYLSLQVGQCELRNANPAHRQIWRRILDLATDTWTFPEAVHPRTGGGCMGDGHHTWAASECVHYVHSLFVIEQGDTLHLLRGVDPDWFTEGREVGLGPLPTHFGPLTLTARREGDELVVRVQAKWRKAPSALHVFSPTQPAQFAVFDSNQADMRVKF